jgi:enoyl-CoA hydratase
MGMSVHVAIDGAVGTLTLDAPPLNLLSDSQRAALLDALADFRARRLRAVILGGRGRAFCAGADLRDEAKLSAEEAQAFLDAD